MTQKKLTEPHDLNAEQCVLGGMLLSRESIAEVVAILRTSDFYRPAHQVIYDVILDLYGKDQPADAVTVGARLAKLGESTRTGGHPYLLTLIKAPPTSANSGHYAEIVREHAVARSGLSHAKNVAEAAEKGQLGRIRTLVEQFALDLSREPGHGREVVLTPVSKVRIRPVRWLWDTTPEGEPPTSHGRMPMHSLNLAAGGPGLGKSQFAVWMSARITRGDLPGQLKGKPRGVIYAATEDSWAYTIAPRLTAAGADLDLVFRIDVKDDGESHARLTLPVDTGMLGKAAEAYSVALLVADPLLSLIDQGINDYRAAEVRTALEPLVAAADRHHFTILGLAHFTKSGGSDPLTRVAGSGAFGQIIRSLVAFAQQENEDGDTEFMMSLAKNNLGRENLPSFKYSIQPVTVDTDEGPSYVSRFVLGEETSRSVRDVMREENLPDVSREETNETVSWLRSYLEDLGGTDNAKDIKTAAKANGISDSAVDRAKRKLGIKAEQTGFGKLKQSFWSLPGTQPAKDDS